jgi:glyoxylase-like metal-dependent hydrolase (beta-lactamase superfamily II)
MMNGRLATMLTRALAPWLLLAAFLLFPSLIAAGVAHAQAPALGPFTARQLAPGIHLLSTPADYRGPVVGNVTVIEQSDGIVLVDSGLTAADGRRITAFVRSLTDKPVKAVLITHWHNDHPQGASVIRAAWPRAEIIATARTRETLLGPVMAQYVGFAPDERFETIALNQASQAITMAENALRDPSHDEATRARYRRMIADNRNFGSDIRGTHLVAPTRTFTDALLIDDPLRPVRLMHLGRANTDGDAIAWLPRERIVITGDIVVSPTPFGFFSFPEDWIGVLQRLKALDFALLVPGHGEPQADAAYLDRLIATITDIRAQVGPLAREGLGLDEVRTRVDFAAQTAIFGDSPRNRVLFEAYWLTPMVENAWREARGDPIIQGGGETTPSSVNRRRTR